MPSELDQASLAPTAGGERGIAPVCAWCGSALDDSISLSGRRLCAICGAATTDPWPSDEELEEAYGSWYRPSSGRFGLFGDRLLRWSRGRLARRLDCAAPSGPVLDVGSGEGSLLDALSALGRETLGLERDSGRTDVRAAEVTEIGGQWAAVVFWHSLEHLRAPGAALAHACGLLADRGLMVIAMPNPDSLQARAFGDRWLALDLPRHLVHVPARSLFSRLRELGMRVERVSHLRGGQVLFGWLHGLVGLLPGHPNLYDAIRRSEARRQPISSPARATTLATAILMLPLALIGVAVEVVARRGGTVYVEARRV